MDYYEVMGLSRAASEEEIKKAYRQLARKYHPDMNPGNDTYVTKFKEIQNIYEVLSDPQKKLQYDHLGYVGRRPVSPPKPKPQPAPVKTKEDFERERAELEAALHKSNIDKIQCSFFGGGSTGRSILVQLKLTSEEMKKGCSKDVIYKKKSICRKCIGDGRAMIRCHGCGAKRELIGFCQICDGIGALNLVCPTCGGEGVKDWSIETVKVKVPQNVQAGHTINVIGAGEEAPNKAPGQLRVVVV